MLIENNALYLLDYGLPLVIEYLDHASEVSKVRNKAISGKANTSVEKSSWDSIGQERTGLSKG